jgi:hypothetical protein
MSRSKVLPVGRFHPANLRAAWWAVRTARRTRRVLEARGLDAALAPPPPPSLPADAERGVRGALRRWRESCLVNTIVMQAWEAAHGRRRDLVIGTTGPSDFRAHAWLHGDPLPPADDPGVDPSVLDASGADDGRWHALKHPNGTGEAAGDGTARAFNELLRRPAPNYHLLDLRR